MKDIYNLIELNLELKERDVIVGQSIPLKITLQNKSEKSLKIPFLIDSGKVTNFALYDDKGKLIGEYNGVTLAIKEGMRPYSLISLLELGGGKSWVWDVDLHRYIKPLAPGTYGVRAIYRYDDEELEITSEMEKFVVRPNHPIYLDVLKDLNMVGMIYTLVIHKDKQEEKILMNMGYDSMPDNFLYGGVLKLKNGARPIISKVDFINAMDFDHDAYRWLAWSRDNSIHAVSVFRGNIKSGPVEIAVDLKEIQLIPRPIQHRNKGVSLFVKGKRKEDDFTVMKIDLDEKGNEVSRITLLTSDEMPHPISVSATHTGDIHIVWGTNGHLPVKWFKMNDRGTVSPITLIPSERGKQIGLVDVIFVEPSLPVGPASNHSVLMMLSGKKHDGVEIRFLRSIIWEEKLNILEYGLFMECEPEKVTPIRGNMIQDQNLSLHGIFTTRNGLVYYVSSRGDTNRKLQDLGDIKQHESFLSGINIPLKIGQQGLYISPFCKISIKTLMELNPSLARFSSLLLSRGGRVVLFYLEDEKGIITQTLVRGIWD